MPTLSEDRIADLLAEFMVRSVARPVARPGSSAARATVRPLAELAPALSAYLDLLLQWNARTNLTAIRDPEEIVRRHFGESLFAGCLLAERVPDGTSLLDYGSGAGFPGLPIKLLLPELRVTLAESQGKKAAFLREAARVLDETVEVWSGRVEAMATERRFDVVTLRAVDGMAAARRGACERLASGGCLLEMVSDAGRPGGEVERVPGLENGWVTLSFR